jgi:hypothetical protein
VTYIKAGAPGHAIDEMNSRFFCAALEAEVGKNLGEQGE